MENTANTLLPMLFDAAMAFAMVAAVIGLISAIWLLLAPGAFNRAETSTGRSFSLRRGLKPLDVIRSIDRHIYRYHKSFGLLIIAASVFTLYRFLFDVTEGKAAVLFDTLFTPAIGGWLFSALEITLILGHLFTIVIGLVIYIRPSALKGIEARANRWISTRKQTRWLETQYDYPEKLLQSYPRQLGFVLLLLSLYLAAVILIA